MLFCREFQYWRNYALFVLIFRVEKCACAVFDAFCMSGKKIEKIKKRKRVLNSSLRAVLHFCDVYLYPSEKISMV